MNVSNSWSTAVVPRTLCGTLWRPVAIVLCRIQDFYRAITASRADRGAGARRGMHNARMHSRIAVDLRLAHIYFPCEYEGPTPSIQVARSKKSWQPCANLVTLGRAPKQTHFLDDMESNMYLSDTSVMLTAGTGAI